MSSISAAAQDENVLGSGITISGLSKTFQLGNQSITALQDTTLHSDKGSFLSLLGPSGCGKTTTLRMLAGLEGSSSAQEHAAELLALRG